MKTLQLFSFIAFLFISVTSFAQTQKQTVKVWGECGMCKKTIEKAAKQAGAASADWNVESKILTVSYDAKQTDLKGIEKSIAAAGYDTKNFTASDEAYKKLHTCCQYERKTMTTTTENAAKCCSDANCCKDMKDCTDKDCCKGKDGAKGCTDSTTCCKH
ncbi:heavy-metal-associated domain-containing protein [Pinibacter aurantiacus]|uniref:Cation transporter n=1 Tax=Pinibacter aurantiacus TaxID=2851599 RepID=A0A9E2W5K5_9BACT|nr:cation transporter [Pinibacter aurantiacus]MBV4358984.1 cation transporter [Pinibacter aurantiacus]